MLFPTEGGVQLGRCQGRGLPGSRKGKWAWAGWLWVCVCFTDGKAPWQQQQSHLKGSPLETALDSRQDMRISAKQGQPAGGGEAKAAAGAHGAGPAAGPRRLRSPTPLP